MWDVFYDNLKNKKLDDERSDIEVEDFKDSSASEIKEEIKEVNSKEESSNDLAEIVVLERPELRKWVHDEIMKVRKVVKKFWKSPVNNVKLQNYIKEATGK